MQTLAQLPTSIPDDLTDEFLKRLPYVSEGLADVRLLPGASQVSFDLKPGFEGQSEVVASRISEVANKLCRNHRPGVSKTVAKQEKFPSSFCEDPHPLLQQTGELVSFG